jgi:hypothetical protein
MRATTHLLASSSPRLPFASPAAPPACDKRSTTRHVRSLTLALCCLLAIAALGCSSEDTISTFPDPPAASNEPAGDFVDTEGTKWLVERTRVNVTDPGGGGVSASVSGIISSSSSTGASLQFTVLSTDPSLFESGAAPKTFVISANPLTVDGIQVRLRAGAGKTGGVLDAGTVTMSTDPTGLVHVTINAEAPLDGVSYAVRSELICSSVDNTAASKGPGSVPTDPGLQTAFCQKFRFLR